MHTHINLKAEFFEEFAFVNAFHKRRKKRLCHMYIQPASATPSLPPTHRNTHAHINMHIHTLVHTILFRHASHLVTSHSLQPQHNCSFMFCCSVLPIWAIILVNTHLNTVRTFLCHFSICVLCV